METTMLMFSAEWHRWKDERLFPQRSARAARQVAEDCAAVGNLDEPAKVPPERMPFYGGSLEDMTSRLPKHLEKKSDAVPPTPPTPAPIDRLALLRQRGR